MKQTKAERLEELVGQFGKMVFATAFRILGNAEDAEDALQDVFLKTLGKWNSDLNPEAIKNWGAYLRVTAVRKSVDLLRRKKGKKQESIDDIAEMESPDTLNPRRLAIQRQNAEILRKALSALPERESEIFSLRFFEDFSYSEIAEHTGLDINLVGVIIHRARERLQEILKPVLKPDLTQTAPIRLADLSEKEKSHAAE